MYFEALVALNGEKGTRLGERDAEQLKVNVGTVGVGVIRIQDQGRLWLRS